MSNIYIVNLNSKSFYFNDIIHASCFVIFKVLEDDKINKDYDALMD